MSGLPIDAAMRETKWDEESRAALKIFLRDVANVPLKVKILELFLRDPYLCLTSASLAHRLEADLRDVQQCASELYQSDAFLYCQSFAYSDLCCLSFDRLSPAMQRNLCLLHFALRDHPENVWTV